MHPYNTPDPQLLSKLGEYAKRGTLGRLQGNKYANRIRCPIHGGESYQAVVYEHGAVVCHTKCACKHDIKTVREAVGVPAPHEARSPEKRREYAERAAEHARIDAAMSMQQRAIRMAENRIGEATRKAIMRDMPDLPDEDYARHYEQLYIELLGLYRDDCVAEIMQDFKDAQPAPKVDVPDSLFLPTALPLSANQIAVCFAVMPTNEAILTIAMPTMYQRYSTRDLWMPTEFTKADIWRGCESMNLGLAKSSVYRAIESCIAIEPIDETHYRMVADFDIETRLHTRLIEHLAKRRYKNRIPLYVLGDNDSVSNESYVSAETMRGNDPEPGPVYAKFTTGNTGVGMALPEKFDKRCPRAWWWRHWVREGAHMARNEIEFVTGWTAHEQKTAMKLAGGVSRENKAVVLADNEADAKRQADHIPSAFVRVMAIDAATQKKRCVVQGPNTYGYEGGDVSNQIKRDQDKDAETGDSHFLTQGHGKTPASKNEKPPRPILPRVTKSHTIHSDEFIINALYREMREKGVVDATWMSGQAVTLDALLSRLREWKDAHVRLEDGSSIPF